MSDSDSIMDDSVFADEGSSDFVPDEAPVCFCLPNSGYRFLLTAALPPTEAQG